MQERLLESTADIVIGGGSAGPGKTFALLLDPTRFILNPLFGAVIFRRESPQITNQGAMWDEASKIYPGMGAIGTRHNLTWRFPSGAKIRFSHLENESDKFSWGGSQIAYIGFDEMTAFTAGQFWYLLSRNRSDCGVRPRIRGTCNPDPDSFVAKFVEWYIDPESGYPIKERGGRIRWFVRQSDELIWADTRKELIEQAGPEALPMSFSFIPGFIETDNPIFLSSNPSYMANLRALPKVERERLLGGNWKIRASAGTVFRREWFEVVNAAPACSKKIRFWDLAASEVSSTYPDPDWTAGLRVSQSPQGIFYVEDLVHLRGTPAKVEQAVLNTASRDTDSVPIGLEQDPGQAGKAETSYYSRLLAGYVFREYLAVKDKVTRAGPASSQAEAGNIKVVRGPWNQTFFEECENFPEGKHDDICLIAGTLVATAKGNIPIENIIRGDRVLTREGWASVQWAGHTGVSRNLVELRAGQSKIIGTRNHPVCTSEGFIPLDELGGTIKVATCEFIKSLPRQRLSNGTGLPSTATLRVPIVPIEFTFAHTRRISETELECFIRKSGKEHTDRSPKALSFIIKILIRLITQSEIWRRCHRKSISYFTASTETFQLTSSILNQFDLWLRLGIVPKKAGPGIASTPSKASKQSLLKLWSASNAVKPLNRNSKPPDFAGNFAPSVIVANDQSSKLLAPAFIARKYFSDTRNLSAEGEELNSVPGSATRKAELERSGVPVFNLKTDGAPEFFANGILVHNCDTLSGACNALMEGRRILVA